MPVAGCDSHLPALSGDFLWWPHIEERLQGAEHWAAPLLGDGGRWSDLDAAPVERAASVLIPLVERPEGIAVLLTRRQQALRAHSGQVSFPGGRQDPEDTDALHTAVREAQEEVGIPPSDVQILGRMPAYRTVTGFAVTPVVARWKASQALQLASGEVESAFEVPLRFLMNPANHCRHEAVAQGKARLFWSMPWTGVDHAGVQQEFFIWGATAAMIRNLYHRLADSQ